MQLPILIVTVLELVLTSPRLANIELIRNYLGHAADLCFF
jgi:hypothetical protein